MACISETHQRLTCVLISSAAKPVISKRTRVVVEEIVDGKVVSRTEEVDSEVIQGDKK